MAAISPILRTDFRPDPTLYPFTSRWFQSPDGTVHYLDEGTGRPLLLMHGNPTWSFLYRKLIPQLVEAGFRCIAPDLMGYGLSEHPAQFSYTAQAQAQVISALLQKLALRDVIVVGQDWGGPIGLGAAVLQAERISGIVVGSTFAWRTTGLVRLIARLLRAGPVQRWMVRGGSFVPRVVRGLTQVQLSSAEIDHYRRVATTPELRRGLTELPRQLIDADDWLAELERQVVARLGKLPALILSGRAEGALGRASCRRFARIFSDHVICDLPRAGHFFQEDAPTEVAAAIRTRFGS